MSRYVNRDRLAVLAALAVPLALAAILIPFRTSFPNTDAALALILVVVAVAANGDRLAGVLAAVSAAVWFDFFLTQPYERFSHHEPDRHRDHRPAAGHRGGSHRTGRLGASSARGRQQARRLSRGDQQRRAGRGRGWLSVRADRAGDGPAHQVADAAIVPFPARRSRDRPACPPAARRFAHRAAPRLGRGRRGLPRGHRRRTAGGKRRPVPGPVPDDPRPRCSSHARTAAPGRRAGRSGQAPRLPRAARLTSDRIGRFVSGGRQPREPDDSGRRLADHLQARHSQRGACL